MLSEAVFDSGDVFAYTPILHAYSTLNLATVEANPTKEDIRWTAEELIRFSIAYDAKSLAEPLQFLTCEP